MGKILPESPEDSQIIKPFVFKETRILGCQESIDYMGGKILNLYKLSLLIAEFHKEATASVVDPSGQTRLVILEGFKGRDFGRKPKVTHKKDKETTTQKSKDP
jgi:hypothetical protein